MKVLVLCLVALPLFCLGQEDLFNYRETEGNDYGPRDWEEVECDDTETCPGWPEKWPFRKGWRFSRNDCENCEPGDDCGTHHQSPVPLDRLIWGPKKRMGDTGVYNCGDNHWMKYEPGTCTFDHMKEANAVTVERHALRISQPVEKDDDGDYRLACMTQGVGRKFSRLDMSGGFSQWWWLNHVEIHTPSEHTQNGKRYAAEVHMGHFYSAPEGPDNGSNNRMATLGVFLDARDNVEPYPYLDKLICQWRHYEDNVRKECGLSSVRSQYPGCFPHQRSEATSPYRNETRRVEEQKKRHLRRSPIDKHASNEEQDAKLKIDPINFRGPDWTEEQWADFQEKYSRLHPLNSTNPFGSKRRHLVDYDHVPHFNYQFLLDCRTEYYFRYEGTQTYPPCFTESNGDRVNVWRFMKDPIKIHPRQVKEMHRLLKERIAPLGSYDGSARECQPDTAAKVMDDGTAWVARPMQELDDSGPGSNGHDNFLCECDDWGSKVPEERAWCSQYRDNDDVRWETNPYNDGAFAGY